jgi:CHAT domain-containing protein
MASSMLVTDFYRELQRTENSKAGALRNVQFTMLEGGHGEPFRHPSFWAPFLLIGNWL